MSRGSERCSPDDFDTPTGHARPAKRADNMAGDAGLQEVPLRADDDQSIFLSTKPATQRDRTLALAVVVISSILFAGIVPFVGMPLTPVPAFVASYQSALAINDLITAILLFSQFAILRTWALLLLASGYLFTAAAALAHALTFPGTFAPTGLFNAGTQTTVWLYMAWHGVFPLLVLGYAWLKRPRRWRPDTGIGRQSNPGERRRGRRDDSDVGLGRHRQA